MHLDNFDFSMAKAHCKMSINEKGCGGIFGKSHASSPCGVAANCAGSGGTCGAPRTCAGGKGNCANTGCAGIGGAPR